ncbi:Uma2 family endonuclease [Candidatus Acetothermia bacterium]|nr:Uma2 family endonuclease [Candidatus Acetothermia bacterium]
MATKATIKFTYEDYLHMPNDKRYELVEGEFRVAPAPDYEHQTVAANLFRELDRYVRRHQLGEVRFAPLDVVLSEEDVVQPDLLFISKARSFIITKKNISGAPDLVIEIISEGTSHHDRQVKRKLYAKNDVKEFWLADPDNKTIEVLSLGKSGYKSLGVYREELRSALFKNLVLDLRKIF